MHRSRFISLSDNTFDRFTIVHFWNYVSYSDDTVRSNVLTFHFTLYIYIHTYIYVYLKRCIQSLERRQSFFT